MTTPGLVVGGPLTLRGDDYELYYLFPLNEEADTLALVQRTLTVAGLVLVLLLAAIAWLVTRQVVAPVRVAARTARAALRRPARRSGWRSTARTTSPGWRRSFNQMAGQPAAQIRQLEDLSRVQRRFVSDVSHELRTPLTTVRMAADVLHEAREEFDPATARSAELLQTQLDRFEALLADLLEISRFDAGAAALDAETGRPARPRSRRVVDAAEPLAERRQADVRHASCPATPAIGRGRPAPGRADPAQPGRATRSSTARARRSTSRSAADDDAVAVGVRDHGVGLRPGRGRSWSSTGSGGPTRPAPGTPAAPGSAWPSRSRTPGCTAAGWRRGAQPGDGAHFRLTLPRRAGAELAASPLPLEPADARADRRVPLSVGGRPRSRDA